ncbi:murein DD-endopeptidase MepM/ murein hydrolase activator NlpD [Clostridiales Family XIII bacterium PM5-7]
MKKKKLLISFVVFALVASLGTYSLAFADNLSDKQDELNNLNNEKNEVSQDMQELSSKIKEQEAELNGIQSDLDKKQTEIDKKEAHIAKTKKDIEKRRDGLNGRLRAMYKNGSVGYLDVLLGSSSISEFISNIDMIQRIYKNDQDTLAELKTQHKKLEDEQQELLTEKSKLNEEKSIVQQKKDALQADKNALQKKLEELNAEADRVSGEISNLQDSDKIYEGGQFMWPTTSTYITSEFGFRIHPVTGIYTGHTGIDIGAGYGEPVYAAASGRVIIASTYGGYGYAVVIDHGSGISTLYGHNSSLNVSVGQNVKRGQVIARVGSTGISTGPHLHFEVRINGSYVDPMSYF